METGNIPPLPNSMNTSKRKTIAEMEEFFRNKKEDISKEDRYEKLLKTSLKQVEDSTTNIFKGLLSPHNVGGVMALATKSPMAGMITAGGLEATNKAASGVSSIFKNKEPMEVQLEKKKSWEKLWKMLDEIIENGEILVSVQEAAVLREQRNELKRKEELFELSERDREKRDLLDSILNDAYIKGDSNESNITFKDLLKSEIFGDHINKLIDFMFSPKGLIGGALIFSRKAIGKAISGMGKTLIKALKPALIVTGIYKGINETLKTYMETGSFKAAIGGLAESIVSTFSLGLINSETYNKITDSMGNFVLDIWENTTTKEGKKRQRALIDKLSKERQDETKELFNNLKNSVLGIYDKWFKADIENWAKFFDNIDITPLLDKMSNSISGFINKPSRSLISIFEKRKSSSEQELIKMFDEIDSSGRSATSKELKKILKLREKIDSLDSRINNLSSKQDINYGGSTRISPNSMVTDSILRRQETMKKNEAFDSSQFKQNNRENDSSQNANFVPINNTVVTQSHGSPLVAPMSKRNNENSFNRALDNNYSMSRY